MEKEFNFRKEIKKLDFVTDTEKERALLELQILEIFDDFIKILKEDENMGERQRDAINKLSGGL